MNGESINLGKRGVLFSLILLLLITFVFADPIGTGELTVVSSTRGSLSGTPGNLSIQGGNVTNIGTINGGAITKNWAGFYGDVTAGISLESAAGDIFYDWNSTDPDGEVFATRDNNPTWSGIVCANSAHVLAEATQLNITGGDNITSTYCTTCGNHSAFLVGSDSFTADQCSFRTNVYNGSGSQSTYWDQILLYEGSNIVYTTIINQNTGGFDSVSRDFQLLVAENSSLSQQTVYFFYVEID